MQLLPHATFCICAVVLSLSFESGHKSSSSITRLWSYTDILLLCVILKWQIQFRSFNLVPQQCSNRLTRFHKQPVGASE
jgi:hypothetical protein